MSMSRRAFLAGGAALAIGAPSAAGDAGAPAIARTGRPRFKIGCCAYSLRTYLSGNDRSMTLEDFIAWAAEVGIDGVELTSYYFPPGADAGYLNRIKRAAFVQGLDVCGAAVGNNFCLPPGPKRDQQVADVQKWIDTAALLGAPCLRIFAGGAPAGTSADEARSWVVACIEACLPRAAERGVILALENHGGVTSDAAGTLAIAGKVNSPWFGLNLDTGNFHTDDPYGDIAQAAPLAVTTHVKGAVTARGKARSEADYARIFSILRQVGYRGYVTLEYEEAGEPKAESARILRRLRGLAAAGEA